MSRIRKIAPEPREANPNPAWADVFGEQLYDQLVDLLKLGGERDRDDLWNALPWAAERYLRTMQKEARPGLPARRGKLESLRQQANRLRKSLLGLKGMASLDFYTTATSFTGATFTIRPQNPNGWLVEAGKYVRDIEVVAGAAASRLKAQAIPGGRPRHAAARILVDNLATIYERITRDKAGRRGLFPRFVKLAVDPIDFRLINSGLDHLIRGVIAARKKLDENS